MAAHVLHHAMSQICMASHACALAQLPHAHIVSCFALILRWQHCNGFVFVYVHICAVHPASLPNRSMLSLFHYQHYMKALTAHIDCLSCSVHHDKPLDLNLRIVLGCSNA